MTRIVKTLQCGVVCLLMALPNPVLWAAEVGDQAKQNVMSAPQSGLAWMSGGIGDEARDEMRKSAGAYNVHLVFSNSQGSYLASVPFRVSHRNGQELYAGVSAGPLLYLKLQPGSYQIAAQLEGIWYQQQINAGINERPANVSFVATSQ